MTATSEARRPATSYDVAARAGVSRSTASFILNGNGARFPESTRQRVLDAAKELEYQPSLAGRSLASGRSDTIVVLLPNTTFGGNLQDAVDEAMAGTMAVGGNVVARFAGSTPSATVTAVLALRPAGVIDLGVLSPAEHRQLEERGIVVLPRVTSERAARQDGGITEVQARRLAARGCRALWSATLADQRNDVYGPARLAALQSFCAEHDLPAPRSVAVPLVLDGAIVALRTVLEAEGDGEASGPVGIACYNDDVALALLAAARELGVAVPDRVALVGVDHVPVGQLWSPRLTTIDVDLRGMVSAIAADLRALLGNAELEGAGSDPLPGQFLTLVPGETA